MNKPYKEESLRWFTHAKDEFEDADELRNRERFYLALFHFQQATEKALKAYLYVKNEPVEVFRAHSVDELSKMAAEIDLDFRTVMNAKRLDVSTFRHATQMACPAECLHGTSMIQRRRKKLCEWPGVLLIRSIEK